MSSKCRQLKLIAADGKRYLTDVIDDETLNNEFAGKIRINI